MMILIFFNLPRYRLDFLFLVLRFILQSEEDGRLASNLPHVFYAYV
jgi:hypothetical protein